MICEHVSCRPGLHDTHQHSSLSSEVSNWASLVPSELLNLQLAALEADWKPGGEVVLISRCVTVTS